MTVIAWDGKTLAGDKRAVAAGLHRTTRKVFKVFIPATDKRREHFLLVGYSGNAAEGMEAVNWVEKGRVPADFPSCLRKEGAVDMIVIDPNRPRVVLKYENGPYPIVFEDELYAMGSGRDFALMAMHLGKSSAQAVQLTAEFQTDCGNGVDAVEL